MIDLISRGEREGALFYRVLRWGAHSEKIIDVYSAIEQEENDETDPRYTIDAAVARLEDVLQREYEKGGTTASIKGAVDRAIDLMHKGTSGPRGKATEIIERAADKVRTSLEGAPPSAPQVNNPPR